MCIDEIITSIRSLIPDKDDGYILYPNEHYTPITDTLDDGTLVALDQESKVWASQDCKLFKLNAVGDWISVPVYAYPDFVRKPNCHSLYPITGQDNGRYPYTAHGIVARAWLGPIPAGYQTDHIDGNRLNIHLLNLRFVKISINHRDGGFIKKLRNKKIPPTYYSVPFLLRFFKRMVVFKTTNSDHAYHNLSHDDLLRLIVEPEFTVNKH